MNFNAIITGIQGGSILVNAALPLILTLKGLLQHENPDIKVEIQDFNDEAKKEAEASLADVNAWLASHGKPEVTL